MRAIRASTQARACEHGKWRSQRDQPCPLSVADSSGACGPPMKWFQRRDQRRRTVCSPRFPQRAAGVVPSRLPLCPSDEIVRHCDGNLGGIHGKSKESLRCVRESAGSSHADEQKPSCTSCRGTVGLGPPRRSNEQELDCEV